VIKDDLATC